MILLFRKVFMSPIVPNLWFLWSTLLCLDGSMPQIYRSYPHVGIADLLVSPVVFFFGFFVGLSGNNRAVFSIICRILASFF